MNLELLESFHKNYPEEQDGILDSVSFALTCSFNRSGTLLAVGCSDGRVALWDFLTRGVVRTIPAHAVPVVSLSWSRNGRKLLTASTDNTVAVWDVLSGECDKVFRFPSPVLQATFHPRDNHLILVCPMRHPPVLVERETTQIIQLDDEEETTMAASFSSRGDRIFVGSCRGKISVIQTCDLSVETTFRATPATSNTSIKGIAFSRRGDYFLLNCSDRIVRVYSLREAMLSDEPEPLQKLKDLVTGNHWRRCCFSGDGEYICAGAVKAHSIYMWERVSGAMVRMLQGTKGETLLDVVWHPLRPIICSISNGLVTVWSQAQVQNWSAFAPDFKELDENVEYEERESEFDLEDEDSQRETERSEPEESNGDQEVDIVKCTPVLALLSSDEEDECEDMLMFLPISPDLDDVEAEPSDTDLTPEKKTSPPPAKKRRVRSIEVDLPGAPTDEVHPFVNVKKSASSSSMATNNSSTGTTSQQTQPKKSTVSNAPASATVSRKSSRSSNQRSDRNKSRKY